MKIRERHRSVADLALGERAVIKELSKAPLALKLLELGCLPGTEVCLEHRVSVNGPLCIQVGGHALSLRQEEAEAVTVCD